MSISFPRFLGPFEGLLIFFSVLYLIALVIAIVITLKSKYYSPIDKLIRVLLILHAPFLGIILVFYEWKYGKI